eukprot:Pgem_evm1s18419
MASTVLGADFIYTKGACNLGITSGVEDTDYFVALLTLEECREYCFMSTDCKAFEFSENHIVPCEIWSKTPDYIDTNYIESDCYIKMPDSQYDHNQYKKGTCSNNHLSQCGGIGFRGDTCCPKDTHCQFQNPNYSDCQEGPPGLPVLPPIPDAPKQCNYYVGRHGQCGGTGFTGSNCCSEGLSCNYIKPDFWECKEHAPTTGLLGLAVEVVTAQPNSNIKQDTTGKQCGNHHLSQCGGRIGGKLKGGVYEGESCCPEVGVGQNSPNADTPKDDNDVIFDTDLDLTPDFDRSNT